MIINLKEIAEKYKIETTELKGCLSRIFTYHPYIETVKENDQTLELTLKSEHLNCTYTDLLKQISYFDPKTSPAIYTYFFDQGVSPNSVLVSAISSNNKELINLALSQGARPETLTYLNRDTDPTTLKLLINESNSSHFLELVNSIQPLKFNFALREFDFDLTLAVNKQKLFETVLEYKPDLSVINHFASGCTSELVELYIKAGMEPAIAFNLSLKINVTKYNNLSKTSVPDPELIKTQKELIEKIIEYKADLTKVEIPVRLNLPNSIWKMLIDEGLPAEKLANYLWANSIFQYDSATNSYYEAKLTPTLKELIDLIATSNNNTDIADELVDTILTMNPRFATADGKKAVSYISPDILKYLYTSKIVSADNLLDYGIACNLKELIDYSITNGATVNGQIYNDSKTFINFALENGNLENIIYLLSKVAEPKIELLSYFEAIFTRSFIDACEIVKILPNVYNEKELSELLRAQGSSHGQVHSVNDYHNLMIDYNAQSLNSIEMGLLTANSPPLSVEEYKNATLITNKYGFGALHLAIIGNNYKLAEEMVEAGYDILAKSNNSVTPLQLISFATNNDSIMGTDLDQLLNVIADKIDNVDIELKHGEILADILIKNPKLLENVLEKTKDPLFSLLKKETDLLSISKDSESTHIAISNGEGFWSTGSWSTARLIMKNHPHVKFHLVSKEMLDKGGDEFIKQFDAFINPGASDSYPKHLPEFTKADCKFEMEIEKLYQLVLEKTAEFNIPYIGMCAGSQHFSLFHGGALKPLDGYNQGEHIINYIPGTLPYFLALTKEQQEDYLKTGVAPQISFKGDTAHHYAAIASKVGKDVILGATSEEDHVAMCYGHKNGIRVATQFHPEHYYGSEEDSAINQNALLDNFVDLAQMFHDNKMGKGQHPLDYMHWVQEQIDHLPHSDIAIVGHAEHS